MKFHICCVTLAIILGACVTEDTATDTSTTEQAAIKEQGMELQGMELQGMELQGMELQGVRFDGVTLQNDTLTNVRVERGELVAQRGAATVRGNALVGVRLKGQVRDKDSPAVTRAVDYRIAAIRREDSKYDPTHTGNTFLYTIEHWEPESQSWKAACPADADGRRVAIPLKDIWDERGDRISSSSMFTLACTTGVIAKCYRWGYRPWLTGYADSLVDMHQTCTRLARADYCGIGKSGTHENTKVNVWDRLPRPGPIQGHDVFVLGIPVPLPPPGYLFEAGWNTNGAVCLSTARWLIEDRIGIARLCPDRLVPPGLLLPTICDTIAAVFIFDPDARMFNESKLNL